MKLKNYIVFSFLFAPVASLAQVKAVLRDNSIVVASEGRAYSFRPAFAIISLEQDPGMALKPAGIPRVSYNVLTWKTDDSTLADFHQHKVSASVGGDGLDDRILRAKAEKRTANINNLGNRIELIATKAVQRGDTVFFSFSKQKGFEFDAWVLLNKGIYPELHYRFVPAKPAFYSIGYTGAPVIAGQEAKEIWQPLIWQEKRIPDRCYLTPAYMAPLPTTLYYDGSNSIGVMASPAYIPFQPLPVLQNSRFGITLLNDRKQLQPQVFAPLPGGFQSSMQPGQPFDFSVLLVVEPSNISYTYEHIAEKIFGFHDYRHNDIASLNTVLDNIRDYSLSHFAWFIDSLKGCAYATDVPGAVKNVSSLNPLELAIVMDDPAMFEKRAYPLMEFMLSREKFLFSLDSTQKIQSPSRKLKGPIAPLSELTALYRIFDKENSFYMLMAKKEFNSSRVRNLDDNEKGHNWINAMYLYKATGDRNYLKTAVRLAKRYISLRIRKPQEGFGTDPLQGSHFFWPSFTGKWIEFVELYECTKDTTFLRAAQQGARQYTQFAWMSPAIPDSMITVNKGGKAPMYWYLKSKGHKQMYYPEEQAPAWRLSEIGLTPESSGTSTGHRAIFMANYAPWMLRLGYYAKDSFLMNVAKAAIIGRYRNFPGYHINTERTTAYEKFDFPLHGHKDQSVNSFHYNHILPMASMLLDYLVTDAFVRSNGQIDFPSEYIEGYAYLQNKFYGASKGQFYTEQGVQLWMPGRLLTIDNVELNYITARKDDKLFIAFTNQSGKKVTAEVAMDPELVKIRPSSHLSVLQGPLRAGRLSGNKLSVVVPANGLVAVMLDDVELKSSFQETILKKDHDNSPDYLNIKEGNTHALLFKLGSYARRLLVYLEDDDNKWKQATLYYTDEKGHSKQIVKMDYPFEFTVPVSMQEPVKFSLELISVDGKKVRTDDLALGKR